MNRLQEAASVATTRWQTAVKQKVALPFIRLRLNQLMDPGFSRGFKFFDAAGLGQVRADQFLIPTLAGQRFERAIGQIEGGTVVLVGPRGAGKTTLLEAYTRRRSQQDGHQGNQGIVLVENAPIEYQPRDFALHLYARLCREVIRAVGADNARTGRLRWLRERARPRRWTLGGLLLIAAISGYIGASSVGWMGWLLTILAGTLALGILLSTSPEGSLIMPASVGAEDAAPTDAESLRKQAQRRLLQISFQQRNTVGWSGRVSVGGLDSSSARSVELAQQSLTHPEVIYGLREFLAGTVEVLSKEFDRKPAPLVIAIDELDRLPPEKATQFVDEIKAILSPPLPGCLLLMSVSDDALNYFGLHGQSARHRLASASDELIRVDQLMLEESSKLLKARIVGLPQPFLWLCHCLSGGLPRDLVRVARAMLGHWSERSYRSIDEPDQLTYMSQHLVAEEVKRDIRTIHQPTALSFSTADRHSDQWVHLTELRRIRSHDMIDFLSSALADSGNVVDQESAVGHLYYYATVLQLFDTTVDDGTLSEAATQPGPGSLNALTAARSLLGRNPTTLGWNTLTAFRHSVNLPTFTPPHCIEPNTHWSFPVRRRHEPDAAKP